MTTPTAALRVTGTTVSLTSPGVYEVSFRTDATAGTRRFVALVAGAETAIAGERGAAGHSVQPGDPCALSRRARSPARSSSRPTRSWRRPTGSRTSGAARATWSRSPPCRTSTTSSTAASSPGPRSAAISSTRTTPGRHGPRSRRSWATPASTTGTTCPTSSVDWVPDLHGLRDDRGPERGRARRERRPLRPQSGRWRDLRGAVHTEPVPGSDSREQRDGAGPVRDQADPVREFPTHRHVARETASCSPTTSTPRPSSSTAAIASSPPR